MKTLLFYFVLLTSSSIFAQGYNFLGSYTSDGTPLYLAPSDVISAETLALVNYSLPENFPVPDYNPHYISSDYSRDIVLDAPADVWVTFVSEGAGYKNVLGFYTYDISTYQETPPTASQITIIFPNVSAVGSGGSLVAGNKVNIGSFPAGTGIGFVLLANGWNGSAVTNGLWRLFSNTSFNPETDPEQKYHNVLLNDPDNERIILGFEDIRRDLSNCDHDFNDAVFYITANPYEAIFRDLLADVSTAANVSSGNNGGLESTGDLAALVAKRNFKRLKSNSFVDVKAKQKTFISSDSKNASTFLKAVLPTTGMYGTETTYVSTPSDLIGITNALEVYSVDYYESEKRVAAVLATATKERIYDHSKAICDRLNNSILEDVKKISLSGYEIIMSKIKRVNGIVEYTLNFSIQNLGSENKFHSYWNIEQYPTGDYANFQVWGSTMGQVSSITRHIISQYQAKGTLTSDPVNKRIPSVFVKNGYYKNGALHLKLINKAKITSVLFIGNQKATETSDVVKTTQNIILSGAYEQDVVISTGGLFDIGFSIQEKNATITDALYLADGPWGIDFVKTETNIAKFEIFNPQTEVSSNEYAIERNAKVSGTVLGTMNLFRNILPGELALEASNFSTVGFTIQNSLPVEVVLVTENMGDWNDRLRIQLPAAANDKEISLALSDFKNSNGQTYMSQKIKGFVFSTIGNYVSFEPFAIEISNLKLSNRTLSIAQNTPISMSKMYNYPNPCSGSTTVFLPKTTETATVKIVDLNGRILKDKTYTVVASGNEVTVDLENVNQGIYILTVTTKENENFQTKLIVN